MDMLSKYINMYNIQGVKITRTGEDGWYQLLMLPMIDGSRVFSFKIRISKCQSQAIMIGIVDKGRREEQTSYSTEYAACYNGYNGHKHPGGIKEGNGFKEGDMVETVVHLRNNTVQWKVNGVLQATKAAPKLGKEYVPYVTIGTVGDSVEWLGCGYA